MIGYLSISIVKYSILIGLKTCIWILFFLHFLTLERANISYCWWKHPSNPMKLQVPNHGKYVFFFNENIKKRNKRFFASITYFKYTMLYVQFSGERALFLILIER